MTGQTATLTADEAAESERIQAELRASGYLPVEHCGNLRVGTRIRHAGHQWPDALLNGTGVVLALMEKPDSAWSLSWHMPDVELIALWDKPSPSESRLSQLAQYHVGIVEVRP